MEVKLAYDGCRNYVLFAFVIFVVMILDGCSRNTITGRSQLSLVPETEVQALAITQ